MFKIGEVFKVGNGPWRVVVPADAIELPDGAYCCTSTKDVALPEAIGRLYDMQAHWYQVQEATRETGIDRYYREHPEAL